MRRQLFASVLVLTLCAASAGALVALAVKDSRQTRAAQDQASHQAAAIESASTLRAHLTMVLDQAREIAEIDATSATVASPGDAHITLVISASGSVIRASTGNSLNVRRPTTPLSDGFAGRAVVGPISNTLVPGLPLVPIVTPARPLPGFDEPAVLVSGINPAASDVLLAHLQAGSDAYLVDARGMAVGRDGSASRVDSTTAAVAAAVRESGPLVDERPQVRGGSALLVAGAPVRDGWVLVRYSAPTLLPVADALFYAAIVIVWLAGLAMVQVLHRRAWSATQRADRTHEVLLATTSHELRTPLTAASGMVEHLAQIHRRGMERSEAEDRALSTVQANLAQLERRITRLLDLRAWLDGEQLPDTGDDRVDTATIVHDAVAQARALAPAHTISVTTPDTAWAHATESALGAVLAELLDNAVRYTPGTGRISAEVRAQRRHVTISISDDGVGLPHRSIDVFAPFQQGEDINTRLRDEGGLGVGLALVRKRVEHMGGTIEAIRLDQGSKFVVKLRGATKPARVAKDPSVA